MRKTFQEQVRELINKNCIENRCDTPDYILAKYIDTCLESFTKAVMERDRWYGFKPWPHTDMSDLQSKED